MYGTLVSRWGPVVRPPSSARRTGPAASWSSTTGPERCAEPAAMCRRSAAAPSWLVAPPSSRLRSNRGDPHRGGAAYQYSPAPLQGAVEPQRTSPDLLSPRGPPGRGALSGRPPSPGRGGGRGSDGCVRGAGRR
ncbi:hypothetical protein CTZ28_32060 [Streptomyces shenzhenensis]|uniref:Uncharacterized protein n=1 Tax=Streptomyces shenzhenensis TaxID=943815 RepID=A0A3M0I708_9ACTN|nr:hypothetical protein CTZ28_32060 [Streptomyces shenzhenensis]